MKAAAIIAEYYNRALITLPPRVVPVLETLRHETVVGIDQPLDLPLI